MFTVKNSALVVISVLIVLANASGVAAWSIATFDNGNCKGKPVTTSVIEAGCYAFPQPADLYYQNTLQESAVVGLSYTCLSGNAMMTSDVECSHIFAMRLGYFADEMCFKADGISFRPVCSTYPCQPKFKLKRPACEKRIDQCVDEYSVQMKWTGAGCRNKKGRPIGDGGCQCQGYCGYACKKACKRDPECKWSATEKVCKTLEDETGHAIPQCLGGQG